MSCSLCFHWWRWLQKAEAAQCGSANGESLHSSRWWRTKERHWWFLVPQSKRERSPRAVVLTINIHSPIDDIWKNSNTEYIRHKCKEGVFECKEPVNELRIICSISPFLSFLRKKISLPLIVGRNTCRIYSERSDITLLWWPYSVSLSKWVNLARWFSVIELSCNICHWKSYSSTK